MQLTGTSLQVDVIDGVTKNVAQAQTLQSVQIQIPSVTLPVPTIEMANGRPYCGNEGEALGNPYNNQAGPRIPGYTINSPAHPNPGSPNENPAYQTPSSGPGNAPGYPYPALTQLNYFWQLPYDPRNIVLRFARGSDRLINRGDVVRSFVLNPASKVAGDNRILAANPLQPALGYEGEPTPLFLPIGKYLTSYPPTSTLGPWDSPFIKQLHSLVTDSGNHRGGPNLILTSIAASGTEGTPCVPASVGPPATAAIPAIPGTQGTPIGAGSLSASNYGMGVCSGALFPGEFYAPDSAPVVTPELNGAFMDPVTKLIPGDWTEGVGDDPDGGFVNKVDEGENQAGYSSPYYVTSTGNQDMGTQFVSYSPNRQVPSPVIFGTLPSRVFQGIPWCTLLFCPNPSANDNGGTDANSVHPGFGIGSATPGPTDYPPYTTPPDHLWLDLFWMPVVEPYAISEPFSTAGKVNMNYEMVPFGGYIHRSTALHAVLKSTRITAISTNFNIINPGNYPSPKTCGFHTDGVNTSPVNYNYSLRYGINLPATIDDAKSGFQTRFIGSRDIFRSATEICNVFLVPMKITSLPYNPADAAVPTDASYNSMQAWWKNFKLTGDNSRESPYAQIYPRLTTKSNSYNVNMRVQVITQTTADRSTGSFNPAAGDSVTGEYRGSAIVERYVDPNQSGLPDFATAFPSDATQTVDPYVRYRVVSTHAFSP